jgi:hypothetical protein
MYQLLFSRQLIVFTTLLALIVLSPAAQAAPQVIYDDALATSWADYSWAAVVHLTITMPGQLMRLCC